MRKSCLKWAAGVLLAGTMLVPVAAADEAARTIVFVDSDVRHAETLMAGLPKDAAIYPIDKSGPAFAQMLRRLEGQSGIQNIHVLSHGDAGRLLIGDGSISMDTLSAHTSDLEKLKAVLAPGADISFYGCNLAASAQGRALVDAIAATTGADVAASVDMTGHSERGANWNLEYKVGRISGGRLIAKSAQQAWTDVLTVSVSIAASATALRDSLSQVGQNGVTYSGTPTILGAFSSNAYGTFTTSGSAIGLASGMIIGTGNVTQVSGTPSYFWDGAGTGNSSGSERDRAALIYTFTPNTGVTKVAFRYVMGSEEYNEYVGQGYSDNVTIRLTGGAYSNTNIAVVPGTGTGIDIDTINNTLNSAYYRDNTVASPPVPDSVLDGHTTVISNIVSVAAGTAYSAEIKTADFLDNRWNSAVFIGYFGAALLLDLDQNNSSGATLANYATTFTEGGAAVAIADSDRLITNYDTTSIQSATITLTNAQTDDVMAIGTLPGGITGSVNTGTPGVITVTLTGASTIANYQTALQAVTFANTSYLPNTTTRNVTVVVNDGTTNSNTATTAITVVAVNNAAFSLTKTANTANITAPGTINYTVTLKNTADLPLTGVNITDVLMQGAGSTGLTLSGPSGDAAPLGTVNFGETWTYTASYAATQANINNGANLVNTVSATTTQTGATPTTAAATTTITQTRSMDLVKSATPFSEVNVGVDVGYTYVVTNTGNVTLTNVGVNDVHNGLGNFVQPGSEILLTDVAPAGDSTDGGANGIWNSLAPGDSVRFTTTYKLVQADLDQRQ